ncbi:hypothetical protein [Acinetobacter bereziniae]|nr:hypothetical protein [Acinetobacter bereziniae]
MYENFHIDPIIFKMMLRRMQVVWTNLSVSNVDSAISKTTIL